MCLNLINKKAAHQSGFFIYRADANVLHSIAKMYFWLSQTLNYMNTVQRPTMKPWQYRLHSIIFESDTFYGKLFDIALLACILLSVIVVMIDSVPSYHAKYAGTFYAIEWVFTILFTIEYILRLFCIRKPMAYALSWMGIIDLSAIIPTYVSLLVAGTQYLLVLRALRLLRIFRIFKLWHFLDEGRFLLEALAKSVRKISIFMLFIIIIVVILGSCMYLIEGASNGFNSIPQSIYWAIVTITTVGYGDVSPATPLGKLFSCILMLCGYGIIAVPTGIVTSQMMSEWRNKYVSDRKCEQCGKVGHEKDAQYCKYCGSNLNG